MWPLPKLCGSAIEGFDFFDFLNHFIMLNFASLPVLFTVRGEGAGWIVELGLAPGWLAGRFLADRLSKGSWSRPISDQRIMPLMRILGFLVVAQSLEYKGKASRSPVV